MTHGVRRDVLVSEVGPRGGLQNVKATMPTAAKKAWITAAAAAGVAEIEVGSFVPAHVLPQLADTAELVAHARAIAGLNVAVLVPNLKGAQAAVAAGAHKITIPLSVSETHSLRNLRRTHVQMLDEVRQIAALIRSLPPTQRPHFEGSLATAFGCTLEGAVPQERVLHLAVALMEAGCDEVGLADTSGYANPAQVRRLIRSVWAAVGRDQLTGIHLHNTRGQGLANVVAALDVGLTTLDASLAGLGGCPLTPGASGSIVTEDLVFMLEAMGLRTGIDIEALFAVRALLQRALPEEPLYGMTPLAGLPKGFLSAALAAASP
ncbi:hydroxymethylglutaryl-CoA lyase [Pseudorhodoferax sp. Leaf274]|uniref:hydroxymethylglutaryl-CoA lyase n=1 Tax=Pseudorhodoferax sp. Leaf274 TaxID=1736318 RepID=UPI0007036E87|nr:hydroxymethylglutaryl-CoA lyase [Pseudorhodoferax sp. Leaf274]KQP46235.1 3-hydroxy-3-methylglutaryl-CoA lyase [Pseudorhodoferax sp. Leaf274]